ncbi:HNH endonuclease [Sphingobium sp.]|uniref:HNH endonuclease n=1 Tax=Sphingobium sp. TaxID=1912891 RepID=UPI002CD2C9C0|nr:HNH endonuclease [Sphingobium sp.]HUD94944.1 HNH endonuclease [Sphingobium sp.]
MAGDHAGVGLGGLRQRACRYRRCAGALWARPDGAGTRVCRTGRPADRLPAAAGRTAQAPADLAPERTVWGASLPEGFAVGERLFLVIVVVQIRSANDAFWSAAAPHEHRLSRHPSSKPDGRLPAHPRHSQIDLGALLEPGSYLDFVNAVLFNGPLGIVERGVLNETGKISGRAQSAVRPLSNQDFNRIIDLRAAEEADFLPRVGLGAPDVSVLREERVPFVDEIERDRVAYLGSRLERDRLFRRRVVTAYDARCAITGLKLINGGGRAEVEAAHIRPVEKGGPDIVSNGLALSGTVHWMFDRGLISLGDDLEVLVSRQANDADSIRGLINRTGFALPPLQAGDRPHPSFLSWHRENCFKH